MINTKSYTDNELVEMIQSGGVPGEIAFQYLYKSSGIREKIVAFLKKMGAHSEDAQDIMHDTFIVLERNLRIRQFKGESSLSTYSVTIAKFKWYKLLNESKKVQKSHEGHFNEIDQFEESEFLLESECKAAKLDLLIGQTTERCIQALTYYKKGFSHQEIAEKMSLKYQSIKNQIHRCFEQLRRLVQDTPGFWE